MSDRKNKIINKPIEGTNNNETVKINDKSYIERCYSIKENVYACLEVSLTPREGLKYSQDTQHLIKKEELPSTLSCSNIVNTSYGNISRASICSEKYNDIEMATDELFTKLIPTIKNSLNKYN